MTHKYEILAVGKIFVVRDLMKPGEEDSVRVFDTLEEAYGYIEGEDDGVESIW